MSTKATRIFRIAFLNQGRVYEIYAGSVSQGDLFGFVRIEDLLFGEKTQIVVDPSEESLKHEFAGVHRVYVPMHAVLRIDEVEKRGSARITEARREAGNVAAFPTPIYTPTDKKP
jgi:hypothetical protein